MFLNLYACLPSYCSLDVSQASLLINMGMILVDGGYICFIKLNTKFGLYVVLFSY